MKVLLSTVEDEVVVVIFLLMLFDFNLFQNFINAFVQFGWALAKRCTHTDNVAEILVRWVDLILDVIGDVAADGMSNDRELLLLICSHDILYVVFNHACLVLKHSF